MGSEAIWSAGPSYRPVGSQAIWLAEPPSGHWAVRQSGWLNLPQASGQSGIQVGQTPLRQSGNLVSQTLLQASGQSGNLVGQTPLRPLGSQAIWSGKSPYRPVGSQAIWLAETHYRPVGSQAIWSAKPPSGHWVIRQSGWPNPPQATG